MLAGKRRSKKLRGPVSESAPETPPAEEDRSVAPAPPKLAGKDMADVAEAVTLPAGGQGAAVASEAVTLPAMKQPGVTPGMAMEGKTYYDPKPKKSGLNQSIAGYKLGKKGNAEVEEASSKFQAMLNRIKDLTG